MSYGQDSIEATLSHLPKISEEGKLLDSSTATRVRAIVEKQNGGLGRLLTAQINQVTETIHSELIADEDGCITVTHQQLRGLVARSAIYGATQALYSAAESLEEGHNLDLLLFVEER